MAKKNDITPPNNVKDTDLYEENVLQGISLKKAECGGENLIKILRFFLSKCVSRIDLLLGDLGWVFTYAMYELEDSSVLKLQKADEDEQVVELLDCTYLFETYGERARQLGNDWEKANSKLHQSKSESNSHSKSKINPIRASKVAETYSETFKHVKSFLTTIYLSKSKDEWVRKFKQAIGKNANEFISRNEKLISDELFALQLSKAHSLYEAIIIATLAIELKSSFFSYPDTDLSFIGPIKNLLQDQNELEKLEPLIKHLKQNNSAYENVEFKDVNILNPFCYKLPSAHSLTGSPKKEQVLAVQSSVSSKNEEKKKSARQLFPSFNEDPEAHLSMRTITKNSHSANINDGNLKISQPPSPGTIKRGIIETQQVLEKQVFFINEFLNHLQKSIDHSQSASNYSRHQTSFFTPVNDTQEPASLSQKTDRDTQTYESTEEIELPDNVSLLPSP
ncbi:MAG: hypothetical protein K0S11_492 [Gammaproteobacteria bacterium]|nr:hypothetical protein [Gammaproteobacteria bacterium]